MTCGLQVDRRRAELAKIHIAAKELGWIRAGDKSQYIDHLFTVCRVRSAADLDEYGRRKFLDHLRACGWPLKPQKREPVKKTGSASDGQIRLIRHIWICLADAGVVRVRSEKGLRSYVEKQTKSLDPNGHGYSAPELLPKAAAYSIIEHLKQWAKRENVDWR